MPSEDSFCAARYRRCCRWASILAIVALSLLPCSLREANAFILEFHRHHKAVVGAKFALAATTAGKLCGVAIIGRPVARLLQDGYTLEVTRLATDGTPNACTLLYGAAWRAARAMGYRRMITYTLVTEPGGSLRATGWRCMGPAGGGTWDRLGRARSDKHPTDPKVRWQVELESKGRPHVD
jgi:hypothetical protein